MTERRPGYSPLYLSTCAHCDKRNAIVSVFRTNYCNELLLCAKCRAEAEDRKRRNAFNPEVMEE